MSDDWRTTHSINRRLTLSVIFTTGACGRVQASESEG